MKKSMFMSTVAMIIVVVVAMSTATFAWFSTFATVSSKTSITVDTAGSGIEIRESDFGKEVADWTKVPTKWGAWGPSLEAITIDKATLAAPQTDIKYPKVTDVQAIPDVTVKPTQFFAATKASSTQSKVIKMTDAATTAPEIANESDRFKIGYKEFQVRKTGSPANITCTVTVKTAAGKETDAASKWAVDSTKVVIVAVKGISQETGFTNHTVIGEAFNYHLTTLATEPWSPLAIVPASSVGMGTLNAGQGKKTELSTSFTGAWKDAIKYDPLKASGASKQFTHVWNAVDGKDANGYITMRAYIWNDGHFAGTELALGQCEVEISFEAAAVPVQP